MDSILIWGMVRVEVQFQEKKNSLICLWEKASPLFLICNIFRYKEEIFPIKYLGIPIKLGRVFKEDWNPHARLYGEKIEGLEK